MKIEKDVALSRNVNRLAHMGLPGGGQVMVQGNYAYIGHLRPPNGTTIVDGSDPRKPKIVSQLKIDDPYMHSHKARVVGDIMITNYEKYNYLFVRKAERLASVKEQIRKKTGKDATRAEVARELLVEEAEVPKLEEIATRGFEDGGFKIWDVKDRSKPRLISSVKTHGLGVHRFDMDERYAYISTEMEGFHGNILELIS